MERDNYTNDLLSLLCSFCLTSLLSAIAICAFITVPFMVVGIVLLVIGLQEPTNDAFAIAGGILLGLIVFAWACYCRWIIGVVKRRKD